LNFCNQCGSADIEQKIPDGDNRLRHCCPQCDEIFYENPKIVAGCIATWQNKVLLCKRAIEPRLGTWTLPAGFMENHETIQEAAARETFEEANAKVANLSLFTIYNLPHISQVYIMFKADIPDGIASPGTESLETEFVDEKDVPWDDLSFPIIRESLELFFEERKQGVLTLHTGEIRRMPDRSIRIDRY
jgi:ADP-ribose pyrophosphatase YjhB (NUDIX family)